MAKHNELGKVGEQIAVNFLLKKGYKILERNYYFKKIEVDIIAQKNNTLAVIEVKTRSSAYYGNPQDFVKPAQIKRIVTAIDYYIQENNIDLEIQFDIIAILKTKNNHVIKHLENAFYHF